MKNKLNADTWTLALGIALFPPLWAVIAPYLKVSTGAVALICAGLYVTNGNKRKDAYVLGTPYVAIIGDKMEEGKIEIEDTKTGEKMLISIDKIANFLKENC